MFLLFHNLIFVFWLLLFCLVIRPDTSFSCFPNVFLVLLFYYIVSSLLYMIEFKHWTQALLFLNKHFYLYLIIYSGLHCIYYLMYSCLCCVYMVLVKSCAKLCLRQDIYAGSRWKKDTRLCMNVKSFCGFRGLVPSGHCFFQVVYGISFHAGSWFFFLLCLLG